jgi:endonuclease/exonuclease/phosphatase family metal-dependent hydrolase
MSTAPPLRIATFNAGLAVGVLPYASERMPHVVEAVAALEADVVFVQEVWLESHWKALQAAAASRFPHMLRAAPMQPARHGACSAEEVAELVACARRHCAGLASDELGRCVLRSCGHAAVSLSTECLNCVVSHPVGTLDEILAPCLGTSADGAVAVSIETESEIRRPVTRSARRSPAYGPPGLMAYGGSFGTAMLSTLPLHDEDVLVYEATTLNARGALYARVETPSHGDVHVFGTHLSPGIHEEQMPQLDDLFAWIREKVGDTHAPTVITGDLNTGPSVGHGTSAFLPALYRRVIDEGFTNPYVQAGAAECTYCHGSLSSGKHGSTGWLIDHVLVRDLPGAARGERILDQPLVVEAAGRRITTTYSDHCGVRVTVDAPARQVLSPDETNPRGER